MRISKVLLIASFMIISILSDATAFDSSPPDHFAGPRKGTKALNVTLKTLNGKTVELADYIGKKIVAVEFGSYTCPIFREKHASMEKLYSKYNDKVEFLLIYTIEAHPEDDACPYREGVWVTEINKMQGILFKQPTTESERLNVAEKARGDMGITVPMFLDDMSNNAWQAYGKAPNSAYIIGIDGRIKLRQGWFKPDKFKQALEKELSK